MRTHVQGRVILENKNMKNSITSTKITIEIFRLYGIVHIASSALAGQSSTLSAMFDWCKCLWGCALIRIVIPSPPLALCIISIHVYGWALYEWYGTIMESCHSEIFPPAWVSWKDTA